MSEMTYIATCPECGRIIAAAVDAPEMRGEVAKEVADWIRRGFPVSRMTCEEARAAEWCTCRRKTNGAPVQCDLFAEAS